MMKLGILGGTFDPIHVGHLLLAEIAQESFALDRVLFVPAGDPPHKQDRLKSPAHQRRAMVELAIDDNPRFELCPVDLERVGPHYSVDTVQLVKTRYQRCADACYFIIGADSLTDLPAWHRPQEFIELCTLAVAHRPGYQPDLTDLERAVPGLTDRLAWVEVPLIGIASSEIRARVQAGRTVRYQVTDRVWQYIHRQGLYRSETMEV